MLEQYYSQVMCDGVGLMCVKVVPIFESCSGHAWMKTVLKILLTSEPKLSYTLVPITTNKVCEQGNVSLCVGY